MVVYHGNNNQGSKRACRMGNTVIGCDLRTAGSSIILNFEDTLTSLELLNYYITPNMGGCKKFRPVLIGCTQRTAGAYFFRTTQIL